MQNITRKVHYKYVYLRVGVHNPIPGVQSIQFCVTLNVGAHTPRCTKAFFYIFVCILVYIKGHWVWRKLHLKGITIYNIIHLLLQREGSEGKLNIVHLLILHSGGSMSIEDALGVVHKSIDTCRKDLQKLVFRKGSVVPRTFKKRFWNICQTNFVYYRETDGFSSPTSLNSLVNAVINEPLKVPN